MTNQIKITNDVLQYWSDNNIFAKSLSEKSEKMMYNFYDGPPFASWDPHYGHLLASSIKDTVVRYMTMRWYRVPRIRWRDCHGMPAESFVEKKLWLKGKKDIENLGIREFVEACRESVRQVNQNRKWFIDHIGRWVDIDHAYYTMDLCFMESVINCFAIMYHDNLIYKGFKVQWYCPSCATGLSNRDILEWYQMRNDITAIVKFPIIKESITSHDAKREADWEHFAREADWSVKYVICVIQDDQGRILSFYNVKHNNWQFVAWHVDDGETIEQAALREVQEELWVTGVVTKDLGSLKRSKKWCIGTHYFVQIKLQWEPHNKEPEKHSQMKYIQIVASENKYNRWYKVNDLIIDDEYEINQFMDLFAYKLLQDKFSSDQSHVTGLFNFLAWTTTPRTLPSNMFLAVGADIDYIQIYDLQHKEYYILAQVLLPTIYKNQSDYIVISTCKGSALAGIKYKPLFSYYHTSDIAQQYKDQIHQVLIGDFVSTSDGVGIVHIAPAFGEDDYQVSASILGKDKVEEWLFMPIDQYWEFTNQVPDFVGLKVHDANKPIIEYLKSQWSIFKTDQISHSYPHCRRCDTPLIYKAMTSRFIKETMLAPSNMQQAQSLNFVPESIKKRFINGLESAPDWNISRNRYRWCPLPVWEAENRDSAQNWANEKNKIVIWSLDELYQLSWTGSKNITKFIFIRHGHTDYNMLRDHDGYVHDSFGHAKLDDLGIKQAQELVSWIQWDIQNMVIYLSPLPRAIKTANPFIKEHFGIDISNSTKYQEIYQIYQQCRLDWSLSNLDILKNHVYQIHDNIYIDFRLWEEYFKDYQDQKIKFVDMRRNEEKIGNGSSTKFEFIKTESFIQDISQKHKCATIVVFAHGCNGLMMHKFFSDFDYDNGLIEFTPPNAMPICYYYDNDRHMSIDLHLPYIDAYRFEVENTKYYRTPEVLDCWFESGAMPFGQFNRLWSQKNTDQTDNFFPEYPADFIAEWLDQTRWWFRALHIIGNAMTTKNAFRNVIVNGMILAEDGKKMSKKLKNYPDPKNLLEQYGADSFRLYTLWSPVVKSEALKFSEKWVEQMFKDSIMPLHNVIKFFDMYAQIDEYQNDETKVFFMRHAQCTRWDINGGSLSPEGIEQLQSQSIKEEILKINPDIIISSGTMRTDQTAQWCQKILKEYLDKDIDIVIETRFVELWLRKAIDDNDISLVQNIFTSSSHQTKEGLDDIYSKYNGKTILIVSHNTVFYSIWAQLYNMSDIDMFTIENNKINSKHKYDLHTAQIIKLPNYNIINELDKHILAELHQMIKSVTYHLDSYALDDAVKSAIWFVDILSNRYIRRSRRRFRWSDMDSDKLSAYHTLYEVLKTYLTVLAPIIPFNTEYLWQQLSKYSKNNNQTSIHLQSYPWYSDMYIDTKLLDEIAKVRKIISMTLYLRAKNQIKIKQPLKKLEIRI
jgi:isoleucyl-tRNA synthetase/phosphohistidine phosphatase SixA/ADP-ribose pyrophosphatase YjhB (NUDIX family)